MTNARALPKTKFFKSSKDFRRWLERNYSSAGELWIEFDRKGSNAPCLNYSEALDQALCFGWTDGMRVKINAASYANCFRPLKPKSDWTSVNVKRLENLMQQGLVAPPGLRAFKERATKRKDNSHVLSSTFVKIFRGKKKAWKFFKAQPAGYIRIASWWVMSARDSETKLRRLKTLIKDSSQEARLALVTWQSQAKGPRASQTRQRI